MTILDQALDADDCWTHGIIASLTTEPDSGLNVEDDDLAGCCG